MSKYYCHECSVNKPIDPTEVCVSGTSYQLNKYLKHTAPEPGNGFTSVYNDETFKKYEHYTITASASGCCEIDNYGRKNYYWYAGETIGLTYKDGNIVASGDTVKLVLNENESKVHSYPVEMGSTLKTTTCCKCGKKIVQ